MIWYYVDAGQQAGPVDEAQLEELRRSGKIQPDTLVWGEGMADWQPYRSVRPETPNVPPISGQSVGAMPSPNEAVCVECNRMFAIQDMIAYGGVHVCAQCKPLFMQKLAEGARINTGALNYAGIGTRFAAVFLDGIFLGILNFVLEVVVRMMLSGSLGSGGFVMLPLVLLLVKVSLGVAYEVLLIGKYGATLGKMACKIKVVTPDGGPVGYLRALGRYFAKILSGMICLIGYLMAFGDDEKRALHDRICNTRVVCK